MANYTAPTITKLGSVREQTLSRITKAAGTGDVIVINGQEQSAPGSEVINPS